MKKQSGARGTTVKTRSSAANQGTAATRGASKRPAQATKARAKAKGNVKNSGKVAFVPKNTPTLSPYFAVRNCADAVDWLVATFGMKVKDIYRMPDGGVAHCELRIGDSLLMCGEAHEEAFTVHAGFYVKDCDAVYARALAGGAKAKRPLADQFYGDRSGTVVDPFGNEWTILTHVQDVSKKEMERRMAAMMSQAA